MEKQNVSAAQRMRRHRDKAKKSGMKKYQGSSALHPCEHTAVTDVVAAIIASRTADGKPGAMASTIQNFLKTKP